MQKALLRVYGPSCSGKTTAIKSACKKFMRRHQSAETILPYKEDGGGDILVVLKVNGITVGFSSGGDYPAQVEKNLSELRKKKCDIIVCATRTWGGTVKAVQKLDNKYHRRNVTACIFEHWVDAEQDPEAQPYRNQCNDNVAAVISKFIDDYIANNS